MNKIFKITLSIVLAACIASPPIPAGASENQAPGAGHSADDGHGHGNSAAPASSEKHSTAETEAGHSEAGHAGEPDGKHGGGEAHAHSGEAASGAKEAEEPEIKIDGLEEEKVRVETVYETVKSNGVVRFHPEHYAKIVSLVPGKLREFKARLGDRVSKGQELAVIESIEIFNAKVEYLKNFSKYEVALAKYENILKMGELGSFTQKNVEEAKNALGEAKSQYDKARIARETARKKHERIKTLVDSGVSSKADLEAADNELKSADVEEESAKAKLDNLSVSLSRVEKLSDSKISLKKEVGDIQTEFLESRLGYENSLKYLKLVGVECDPYTGCVTHELGTFSIYSPIDGVVIEQNGAIGSSIDCQNPVMCVGDYDRVMVDIDIYEKDLSKIGAGQTVEVETASGAEVAGKIVYVSNQLESSTRTLKARAEITEDSHLLKIGEFVNCAIQIAARPGAITIPTKAIVEDGDRQLVYVKCGKTYDKTYIKTGHRFADRVEVREGLLPANVVVTVGNYQIFNMGMSGKLELNCETCK